MKWVYLVLLASLLLFFCCTNNEKNQDVDPQMTERAAMDSIEVFGVIKPGAVQHISLGLDVEVREIHVDEGEEIREKTPLLTLDLSSIYIMLSEKEYILEAARLELERLNQEYGKSNKQKEREYRSLKKTLEIARKEEEKLTTEYKEKEALFTQKSDPDMKKLLNEIETSSLQLDNSLRELEKKKTLFASHVITEEEVLACETLMEEYKTTLHAAELSLEKLVLQKSRELTELELSMSQKRAEIEQLEIQIEHLSTPEMISMEIKEKEVLYLSKEIQFYRNKLNKPFLQNQKIISPLAHGVVESLHCTPGDFMRAHSLMVSVIDLNSLVVEAHVPEEFLKDITIKGEAIIKPLADPDKKYDGIVTRISAMAVKRGAETVVPVIVSIEDNDGFLLPNFNVDVEIYR